MKFIFVVEDDRNIWSEEYNKPEIENLAQAEEYCKEIIEKFNNSLRRGELPRRYVEVKECEQQPEEPEVWECGYCNGTGQFEPDCEECEGRGWVNDPEDGGTMTCPVCENEPCDECDGTGGSQ